MNQTDLRIFKDLIWIDGIRGLDNTGVVSISYDALEDYKQLKVTGGPDQLFDRKHLDDVVKDGVLLVMGHNRYKTMGSVAAKNAHPFVFDNVIGAHNGTLSWRSKNQMKNDLTFDTDSEALFNDMNEFGFEDTIKRMDGAWALTWYDRKTKQLNFHRNKERPLWYVMDKNHTTVYWASEPGFLYLVLNRNGVEFTGKVREVPVDTWIQFQLNDQKGFQLDKPVYRNLVAPPFVVPQVMVMGRSGVMNGGCGADNFNRRFPDRSNQQQGKHNGVHWLTPQDRNNDELVKLLEKGQLSLDLYKRPSKTHPGYYVLRSGTLLFEGKFNQLMEDGCAICDSHPIWTEPVKFLRNESFVCASCLLKQDDRETVLELIRTML